MKPELLSIVDSQSQRFSPHTLFGVEVIKTFGVSRYSEGIPSYSIDEWNWSAGPGTGKTNYKNSYVVLFCQYN
jgi:hypothetical protein